MSKIKELLKKDVVYIYKRQKKNIIFNIGLYIVMFVGLVLSWYLTGYVVFSFATMY